MISYTKESNCLDPEEIKTIVEESLLNKPPSLFKIFTKVMIPVIFQSIRRGEYTTYAHWGLLHLLKYEDRDISDFEDDMIEVMNDHDMMLYRTTNFKGKGVDYRFKYPDKESDLQANQLQNNFQIGVNYTNLNPRKDNIKKIRDVMEPRMPALLALGKVLEF